MNYWIAHNYFAFFGTNNIPLTVCTLLNLIHRKKKKVCNKEAKTGTVSLLPFCIASHLVIALSTIAIAIVVALKAIVKSMEKLVIFAFKTDNYYYHNSRKRAITICIK